MRCRLASAAIAAATLLTSPTLHAQDAPGMQAAPQETAGDFRTKIQEYRAAGSGFKKPAGEITVTADRTEWQQSGITRCTGNVRLVSDTMELRGDVLELKQYDDGKLSMAHVTGDPAQLTDSGSDTSPPITAHAKKLDYDAKTNMVELSGGAVLTRGSDKITGDNMRYDVAERRVQATGGNSGQVKIVIQPSTPKAARAESSSPAPATQGDKTP